MEQLIQKEKLSFLLLILSLGILKTIFAYYLSNKYGLVDIYNSALQAQWDWISDVDTNSIVCCKNKKNQFGLNEYS
jgi:hypothetical protein